MWKNQCVQRDPMKTSLQTDALWQRITLYQHPHIKTDIISKQRQEKHALHSKAHIQAHGMHKCPSYTSESLNHQAPQRKYRHAWKGHIACIHFPSCICLPSDRENLRHGIQICHTFKPMLFCVWIGYTINVHLHTYSALYPCQILACILDIFIILKSYMMQTDNEIQLLNDFIRIVLAY